MLRCVAVALCSIVVLSSSALAQVVYEPVRYQYETPGGRKYYYGGVDGRVHAVAAHYAGNGVCRGCSYGANLHNFDGGNTFNQPSPMYDREPVYTDCVPFRDARRFGYTAADARNEAYANAPTYFRKADLLASAIPTTDGGWVVPANAPVYVVPGVVNAGVYRAYPSTRTTTSPATRPGQVIIIPKRLMEKKVKDLDQKPLKVAAAK